MFINPDLVLNQVPTLNPEDVMIPFVYGPNGLQYIEVYLPEKVTVMAMVAERSLISLCHVCPTLMKHPHKVASDIPKLRKMDFKYHYCVEAKMKHAPKVLNLQDQSQ